MGSQGFHSGPGPCPLGDRVHDEPLFLAAWGVEGSTSSDSLQVWSLGRWICYGD